MHMCKKLNNLLAYNMDANILFSFVVGTALSCYGCDSKNDPDCKEFFDHENINSLTVKSTECQVDAAQYCIKTTGVWGGMYM